jgi:arylsulfatase A-like enzyme
VESDGRPGQRAQIRKYRLSKFVIIVSLAVLALSGLTILKRGSQSRKMNVLFILVDTLRYDAVSLRVMPNLFEWMDEGIVFTETQSASPWTKPSVTSILTGIYPDRHGQNEVESSLPEAIPYLPAVLKDNGYNTYAFQTNAYLRPGVGFERGFDHYDYEFQLVAGEINRAILDFIDAEGFKKPYFTYIHYMDPHLYYYYRPGFISGYDPESDERKIGRMNRGHILELLNEGDPPLTEQEKRWLLTLYIGEVRYWDMNFAYLMKGLQDRGLLKNTLIVIVSDHGEEFFEHGGFEHGHSFYNEVIHIPFMIRIPGFNGIDTVETAIPTVDIMPTLLDLLDLDVPSDLDGGTIFTASSYPSESAWEKYDAGDIISTHALYEGYEGSLLSNGLKLIIRDDNSFELYDTAKDPYELNNIAGSKSAGAPDLPGKSDSLYKHFESIRDGLRRQSYNYIRIPVAPKQLEELRELGYIQ